MVLNKGVGVKAFIIKSGILTIRFGMSFYLNIKIGGDI